LRGYNGVFQDTVLMHRRIAILGSTGSIGTTSVRLIDALKNKGVRIDGTGLEAHWSLDYPALDEIDVGITTLANAGVKVIISEMDVAVLPYVGDYKGQDIKKNPELQKAFNPYPDKLPAEMQNSLAKRYYDIFSVFHANTGKISRVTFWGINDSQSWLNYSPIGRTDYPLLFDRNYEPKPAFYAVVKTAQSQNNSN
jgi:endo-1,4-beta-xylanase